MHLARAQLTVAGLLESPPSASGAQRNAPAGMRIRRGSELASFPTPPRSSWITQQVARFALAGRLAVALATVHTSAPVAYADPMPPPEPSPTEPAPAQVDPPPPASSWDIGGRSPAHHGQNPLGCAPTTGQIPDCLGDAADACNQSRAPCGLVSRMRGGPASSHLRTSWPGFVPRVLPPVR